MNTDHLHAMFLDYVEEHYEDTLIDIVELYVKRQSPQALIEAVRVALSDVQLDTDNAELDEQLSTAIFKLSR